MSFHCFFLVLVLVSLSNTPAIAQPPLPSTAGFINIDCGKPSEFSQAEPSVGGLVYTSNFAYINTGEVHQVNATYMGLGDYPYADDLRSFPVGPRNCYSITPVTPSGKYLVRATFRYGNYDGKNMLPNFALYLGNTFWAFPHIEDANGTYYSHIITIATSTALPVCLVDTGFGTPFVSAIEVRPLPSTLYPEANGTLSLATVVHTDFGNEGTSILRYPNDTYDRLWKPRSPYNWDIIQTALPITTSSIYGTPSDVMATASTYTWSSLFSAGVDLTATRRADPLLGLVHLAELKILPIPREFTISVDDVVLAGAGGAKPEYLTQTTVSTGILLPHEILKFQFAISPSSTESPIINAMEVFRVVQNKEYVATPVGGP